MLLDIIIIVELEKCLNKAQSVNQTGYSRLVDDCLSLTNGLLKTKQNLSEPDKAESGYDKMMEMEW